jgi:hypothetical protein
MRRTIRMKGMTRQRCRRRRRRRRRERERKATS